jgi:sugar phosphate permease
MANPKWWEYNYTVLLITWTGWISIYLARSVLPPLLPILTKDLGLSYTQSGLLETAYLIGYIIVKIPAGFMANKYGSKKVLIISMVGYGLANSLIFATNRFIEIFMLRLLVGLFQGVHLPVANALLSDRFKERQGRAIGFNESGPNIGNTVAYPLAISILSKYGWRYAFIFLSFPAFLLSLAAFFLMKQEEPTSIPIQTEKNGGNTTQYLRILLPFALSHGTYNLILRTSFTFTPIFLVDFRNISIESAGLISMILPLAGVLSKISSGFILERIGKRLSICGAIILSSLFLSTLVLFPINELLPINLIFLGLTLYSFSPIIYSSTTSSLPSRFKSLGLGIVTMFGNIVGAFSTSIIGKIIDLKGFGYSFLALSGLAFLSAFLIYFLLND